MLLLEKEDRKADIQLVPEAHDLGSRFAHHYNGVCYNCDRELRDVAVRRLFDFLWRRDVLFDQHEHLQFRRDWYCGTSDTCRRILVFRL